MKDRYKINFDKTINQLVPYYLGGRKLILYLQSLMAPLQKLSNDFDEYARETRIEASMTSQIFKFEWYLNRKFQKYFASGDRISISNSSALGTPIYFESANLNGAKHIVMRQEKETGSADKRFLILYHSDENTKTSDVSFFVQIPKINTQLISEQELIAQIRYIVDKYRIANKTYNIIQEG